MTAYCERHDVADSDTPPALRGLLAEWERVQVEETPGKD
jgi:hypothetical protein